MAAVIPTTGALKRLTAHPVPEVARCAAETVAHVELLVRQRDTAQAAAQSLLEDHMETTAMLDRANDELNRLRASNTVLAEALHDAAAWIAEMTTSSGRDIAVALGLRPQDTPTNVASLAIEHGSEGVNEADPGTVF